MTRDTGHGPGSGQAITVESHAGAPPPRWDDTLKALGAGVFHSSAWAGFQKEVLPCDPHYLLARDARGGPIAAALCLFQRSRHPLASWFLRGLLVPSHPVRAAGRADAAERVVRRCAELGRELGCARLLIDSTGSYESEFRPSAHGFREARRVEFVADLTAGLEKAWSAVDKKQRERIRRLERSGVEVVSGRGRAEVEALQALRRSTWRKRTERGQGYILERDAAYDSGLQAHLLERGFARVFVARVGAEPAGAILFAEFGGRAYSVFSGSSAEGYRLGVQSILYWRALQEFSGEGFVELNRGGVPGETEAPTHPLHGIYSFKHRLGTRPVDCWSGVRVLSRWRASLVDLRLRARKAETEGEVDGG